MSSEWTPPADGAPCWINIFATDVTRGEHAFTLLATTNPDQHSARKFWSEALGWKFRESTTRMDGTEENPEEIAHFEHGANCPGGGITKVDEVVRTEGKGGNVLYLYVNDLGATEKVSMSTCLRSWTID
jgi:predicted enzyme related to lactoylglutathione lyase